MSYIISSTEKTRKSASDFETKALFYLMCFGPKNSEIHYFVVDVFNDLSGHDSFMRKAWDLQSKGGSSNSAKKIGEELVTLYKNYLSELTFDYSILFIKSKPDSFGIDENKMSFSFNNIDTKAANKIKEGLKEKALLMSYIDNRLVTNHSIDDFLERVLFVVGDFEKSYLVKSAVSNINPKIFPSNDELEQIFNSIRDEQSTKKNYGNIEGKSLERFDDSLFFKRHLTVYEIKLKILNEIIGRDIVDGGVPVYLTSKLSSLSPVDQNDYIESCKLSISKVFCDKNNAENFWFLFNEIHSLISNNKSKNVDQIYDMIPNNLLENVHLLDVESAKFFIAKIMEAIICI